MSENFSKKAKAIISTRMAVLVEQISGEPVDQKLFKLEQPADANMGHIAFACFPLAKALKKSPQVIATELANTYGSCDCFEKIEANGPYVNFFFESENMAKAIFAASKNEDFGYSDVGQGKKILLEYSSPNTNKPLHLGHGRNNLLGMALANLFETQGYSVTKVNLVNDRGIHICKSMLAYQKWGAGATPTSEGIKGDKLVGNYYVKYDQELKKDESLEAQARELLQKWEASDPETLKLWEQMNNWVYDGFKKTYTRMGANFDKYYYESQTFIGGKELVLKAFGDGLCQKEENGAISIDLEAEKLGKKILLRGDGTSMYITQDLNTTVTKFADHAPLDSCLFVVGNEQDNHFRVLFKTLEKLGYDWAKQCEHISYGMITLPEGKMKSREGTVVDLDELMEELKDLSLEEINKRANFSDSEAELKVSTAEAIGQAALKFFILRSGAQKEIQFNPKESLAFEGQTGPYLQYVYARISSLLSKVEDQSLLAQPLTKYPKTIYKVENHLLLHLSRLNDALTAATTERNPSILCNWAYELCKVFNKFYNELHVLNAEAPELQFRIQLTSAVQKGLGKALNILGITAINKM